MSDKHGTCYAYGTPSEPCWGYVVVVDYTVPDNEDSESAWIYSCEGHELKYAEIGGSYLPEDWNRDKA